MTEIEDKIKRLIVKYSDSIIMIKDNKEFAIKKELGLTAIVQCEARLSSHKMMLNDLVELRKACKDN